MSDPTVYIVDDDEACRDAALELVRSERLPAEGFASAHAFLETFDATRAGCLVLDMRMPRMDGLALQAHLIALGARIPIIFVSGHSDIAMAVQAIRHGASDFVQKPYPGQQLLDAIQRSLKLEAGHSASTVPKPEGAGERSQVPCANCPKVQVARVPRAMACLPGFLEHRGRVH
jgi:FixJ family two-component response regulator